MAKRLEIRHSDGALATYAGEALVFGGDEWARASVMLRVVLTHVPDARIVTVEAPTR